MTKAYGTTYERKIVQEEKEKGRNTFRSAASIGTYDVMSYDKTGFYFYSVKATRNSKKTKKGTFVITHNAEMAKLKGMDDMPSDFCPNCKTKLGLVNRMLKIFRRGKCETITF